jgi:hypothetical protein
MPSPEQPSYEDLAARNAELLAVVAEQAALIGALRAEVAALRRQVGMTRSTSSGVNIPASTPTPIRSASRSPATTCCPGLATPAILHR